METVYAVLVALGVITIIIIILRARKAKNNENIKETENVKDTEDGPLYSLTQEEFKSLCKHVSYEEIARFPQRYINKKIKIMGEVYNVKGAKEHIEAFMYALPEISFSNKLPLLFEYDRKSLDEPRILNKDNITIYGIYKGLFTDTNILNEERTIPYINAIYVEIHLDERDSEKTDKKEKVSNLKSA